MRQITFLILIVSMFTLVTSTVAKDKQENWEKFSQSLVETIKSQNDGLKQSAMQRIIQYSDKLDVKEAAFDIYNVYRWHNNDNVRRLALVALYNTKYDWAMNQIVKDIKIEHSPALKRQMIFMVNK
ncbi:hypothetical protein ACFLSX_00715 [Calditrichota bacterium]